jgi:hypothetical protein
LFIARALFHVNAFSLIAASTLATAVANPTLTASPSTLNLRVGQRETVTVTRKPGASKGEWVEIKIVKEASTCFDCPRVHPISSSMGGNGDIQVINKYVYEGSYPGSCTYTYQDNRGTRTTVTINVAPK